VWEEDFDSLDNMEVPSNLVMEFEINDKQPLDVTFPTQISNFVPERQRTGV
jgi:beta-galactosidase/beta-glucuronidase